MSAKRPSLERLDAPAGLAADAERLRRRVSALEDALLALSPRTDVVAVCVLAGWLEVGAACAPLCRETWRCVPPGLTEAEADCVRRGHPIWSRLINVRGGTGATSGTRLHWASSRDVEMYEDVGGSGGEEEKGLGRSTK